MEFGQFLDGMAQDVPDVIARLCYCLMQFGRKGVGYATGKMQREVGSLVM